MRRLVSVACVLLVMAAGDCPGHSQVDPEPGSRINVTVDPRIELLAVVQYLSGYDVLVQDALQYKDAVDKRFSDFRDHEAVRLFGEMRTGGFSYDAPPAAMLNVSAPPELAVQVPFTDYVARRAGGREQLEEFIEVLRSLAEESDFMGFFEEQAGFYGEIVGEAQAAMGDTDYAATLEDYYGVRQSSYNLILAPLFRGGYGPRLERDEGAFDVYNITGPWGVQDGRPQYGSAGAVKYICIHEFGHSFVNPIVEEFEAETNRYSALYEPIADEMKRQAYGGWLTCAHEHIIRAVTARMVIHEAGETAGRGALSSEYGRGFRYVKPLCEALERYEAGRTTYPTFRDFYPELLKVFEECTRHAADSDFFRMAFVGPINGVLGDANATVVVLPTNEGDAAVQEAIHDFAERFRDRFLAGAALLTDAEALQQDLAGKYVIAFGTLAGNRYLAELAKALPVRIRPDGIVADREYRGTGLSFITCWPNPADPTTGVLVYTAQRPEDVVDANAVFHGPTDWVVAEGQDALASGNYDKMGGTWAFE